jgi:spoIIIJ-associated protein
LESRSIEITGKTTEVAVQNALAKLGVPQDQVVIEVLEEARSGFMGFIGSKPAKVRVTVRENKSAKAEKLIEEIVKGISLDCVIEKSEKDGRTLFNIEGRNVAPLIGKRGATLEAIQHIVNTIMNRGRGEGDRFEVEIDVSGYRDNRRSSLEELANRLAAKVMQSQKSIELEPMNSSERRIIHMCLKENPRIYTYSKGEEPHRKVVISAKEKQGKRGPGEGEGEGASSGSDAGRSQRPQGGGYQGPRGQRGPGGRPQGSRPRPQGQPGQPGQTGQQQPRREPNREGQGSSGQGQNQGQGSSQGQSQGQGYGQNRPRRRGPRRPRPQGEVRQEPAPTNQDSDSNHKSGRETEPSTRSLLQSEIIDKPFEENPYDDEPRDESLNDDKSARREEDERDDKME